MKSKNDFPFSDEDLKEAARLVGESMLASLPTEIEPPHIFSEAFNEKMNKLFAKEKARSTRRRFLRSVAAVLVVILTVSSIWLATDADAWADFRQWIRHVSGFDDIYEFYGPTPSVSLPKYEITWLPEGYVFSFEMDEDKDGESIIARRIAYENPGQDMLFLAYNYMVEGHTAVAASDEQSNCEEVTVAGMEGVLYYNEGHGSNVLVWFDEEAGIAFALQTNLDRALMFQIAESVQPAA